MIWFIAGWACCWTYYRLGGWVYNQRLKRAVERKLRGSW